MQGPYLIDHAMVLRPTRSNRLEYPARSACGGQSQAITRRPGSWPPASSGRIPLDQLARDDDALHFVGAFADAHERCVAHQPFDREFLRVAVRAVDAHRFERVLEARFGGEVFRHAGLHVAAPARIVGLRRLLDQQARRLEARRHLAELELDCLVLADRLAEGLAQLRVADRFVERRLGDARAARGHVDAPELEPAHGAVEALPLAADEIRGGHAEIFEDELRRVDALVADLLELARGAEPRAFLHDEHRQALARRLRLGICPHQHGAAVPFDAVADPGFGAVDHVVVALLHRAG